MQLSLNSELILTKLFTKKLKTYKKHLVIFFYSYSCILINLPLFL